ncbi:hypothetical protein OGAPHI_002937 [Ogataea philodendri]|uniref:Uncharacterized protein n=1 Tax=Ogataea philodendri TaxID=1378263 RepID=A0A9P8P834_9ASCO|nr:uncharacterized protein OGAPHI_002937 [Ogataea philodendri]KAH3667288.1 hypothetical protein OGAPHI_002937 [Ogataea philodendri]
MGPPLCTISLNLGSTPTAVSFQNSVPSEFPKCSTELTLSRIETVLAADSLDDDASCHLFDRITFSRLLISFPEAETCANTFSRPLGLLRFLMIRLIAPAILRLSSCCNWL